ncbi:MAG: hypothetical protein LBR47_06555 [Spirochaetaceae bacterium]|jgi:pectinesterase|nr:hypothetical protein [Spirochaetaceae bacterium]
MYIFRDTGEAEAALTGREAAVTVLFSARGSYQRGGYAPWPLFECLWHTGDGEIALRHNRTNQIKCSVGQINLDTTAFSDISVWRQYRLELVRLNSAEAEVTVSIDGTEVWKNRCPPADDGSQAASISLHHPEGSPPHVMFGYIIIVPSLGAADAAAVAEQSLGRIAAAAGIDPFLYPAADESCFTFEPLPPVPDAGAYEGDACPFTVLPGGKADVDPELLPSGGRVRKVRRPAETGEPFPVPGKHGNGVSVFAGDWPVPGEGFPGTGPVFSSVAEAVEALPPEGGTVYAAPGIYTGPLDIPGKNAALIGSDPFTTIITGYAALTNGIRRNVLVRAGSDRASGDRACSDPAARSFRAENITFWNKGSRWNTFVGYPERRGAAFGMEQVCGALFRNCLFLGEQDTLYLRNGIARFDTCYIEGDIDFICGGATVLFNCCHLHILNHVPAFITAAAPVNDCIPPEHPLYEALTGKVRVEGFPGLQGFIFHRCLITMDSGLKTPVHLGRGPWRNGSGLPDGVKEEVRSSVTFIDCDFGTETEPFLIDRNELWCSMDAPMGDPEEGGELYRVYRCRVNGAPL